MRRPTLPLRAALTGLLALGLVGGIAACSSSDDTNAGSSTTKAPEGVLVSNAKVTTGLAGLGQIAARAAASDRPAKSVGDEAEQQWQEIEGRIKKNDARAYLAFEDGLSDLRTGAENSDAAKVRKGAAAIAAATTAYLAKYPG